MGDPAVEEVCENVGDERLQCRWAHVGEVVSAKEMLAKQLGGSFRIADPELAQTSHAQHPLRVDFTRARTEFVLFGMVVVVGTPPTAIRACLDDDATIVSATNRSDLFG